MPKYKLNYSLAYVTEIEADNVNMAKEILAEMPCPVLEGHEYIDDSFTIEEAEEV